MPRSALPVLALVCLVVSLAACGSGRNGGGATYVVETPVGSGTWVEAASLPAWTSGPDAQPGVLRFVADAKSNLRSIVTIPGRPSAEKDATAAVRAALEPVLGAEAATAAAARVPEFLEMTERACREEVLTKDPVPGNTLCTAWALWELPIDAFVETVPQEKRAAAKAALETR